MKQLIIFTLLLGLVPSLLLHSQAVKVTDSKEVQIGKGDPQITNIANYPLHGIGAISDVHALTFGDGIVSNGIRMTDWNWGIQYAGCGLSFMRSYLMNVNGNPNGRAHIRYLFLSDNGYVGINTITPQYRLDVDGIICAHNVLASSDKRLKKDISPLFTNTYDLNKLNSITYKRNYLEDEQEQILHEDTNTHYGFIAQELREIYPELVFEDEKGYLSVNYIGMIPVLVNAIKELRAEIDVLKGNGFVKANTTEVALSAKLYQNNPNPFSEQTEIKYYIPSVAVNATLCVYDLNGSQILKMDIAGRENGSISINANQLKAGMYLYTLLVDGKEVDTKKMILTGE